MWYVSTQNEHGGRGDPSFLCSLLLYIRRVLISSVTWLVRVWYLRFKPGTRYLVTSRWSVAGGRGSTDEKTPVTNCKESASLARRQEERTINKQLASLRPGQLNDRPDNVEDHCCTLKRNTHSTTVCVRLFVFGHSGGGKKAKAKHDRSRQQKQKLKQQQQQQQHQRQSTPLHSPPGGEVPGSEEGDSIMSVRYSRVTSGDGPSRSGTIILVLL